MAINNPDICGNAPSFILSGNAQSSQFLEHLYPFADVDSKMLNYMCLEYIRGNFKQHPAHRKLLYLGQESGCTILEKFGCPFNSGNKGTFRMNQNGKMNLYLEKNLISNGNHM